MNTTNNISVSKTLIAVVFTFASASGFAADVSVNAGASSKAETSARVDNTDAHIATRSDNSANANASADEKAAVESAENGTDKSKDQAVSLGETVHSQVSESGSAIVDDAANLEGSIGVEENVDLVVETVDGIAIDLTSDTVAEVSGNLDTSLGESEQAIRSLTDAASETSVEILGNTTGTAGDIAESVEAGADIGGEVDTMAESSSELPEMDDQRADIESATSNQTSGGLGLL